VRHSIENDRYHITIKVSSELGKIRMSQKSISQGVTAEKPMVPMILRLFDRSYCAGPGKSTSTSKVRDSL
jgi:hypothetical protein